MAHGIPTGAGRNWPNRNPSWSKITEQRGILMFTRYKVLTHCQLLPFNMFFCPKMCQTEELGTNLPVDFFSFANFFFVVRMNWSNLKH